MFLHSAKAIIFVPEDKKSWALKMAFVFLYFSPFSFCLHFFYSPSTRALAFCELIPLFEVKIILFRLRQHDVAQKLKYTCDKTNRQSIRSGNKGFEDSGFGKAQSIEHVAVHHKAALNHRQSPWIGLNNE